MPKITHEEVKESVETLSKNIEYLKVVVDVKYPFGKKQLDRFECYINQQEKKDELLELYKKQLAMLHDEKWDSKSYAEILTKIKEVEQQQE